MHLSKKTAILTVIAIIGFELAVVTGCVYALARSSLGKTLQTAIAQSAVQAAAPKHPLIRLNPSRFRTAAYAPSAQQEAPERPYAIWQTTSQAVTTGKYLYGNPNARFTLVEFSDFECPFCQSFHHTLKRLVEASQGNINWQWKHLPLHLPASQQAAEAAECVAQQQGNRGFWMFAEALFTHTRLNGAGVPDLDALLKKAAIDFRLYHACLRSGKAAARVAKMQQEALALGIDGTPATLIVDHATGNRRLIRGMQPAQALIATLQRMLEEARQTSSKTSIHSSGNWVKTGKQPHNAAVPVTR